VSLEADSAELVRLEDRINALLPPRYVGCFEDVSPTSMGSAKMRYDAQGRVAWGEIWTTFCHLALAGGPPHRGRLLEPVTLGELDAAPSDALQAIVAELERALRLTVDLPLVAERRPGWVGLRCDDGAMAAWLTRAVMAENVFARREKELLFVPVGPSFRIEKEVKNVVVSLAKSCHYLLGHVDDEARPTGDGPTLIAPPLPEEIELARDAYAAASVKLRLAIEAATPLPTLPDDYAGWLGLECGTEDAAVWMLRAVAVEDVLVRREESRLYVPVSLDPAPADALDKTAAAVVQAHRLWTLKNAAI
jgi:sirohydrochlorin cobaltochelatase